MSTLQRSIAGLVVALPTVALATVSTTSFANPPAGKGNANQGNQSNQSNQGNKGKQAKNGTQGPDNTVQLITAGISLVAARQLALDTGAIGFKPLPPGISKNLARGKPLPPGIASRNLPDSLLWGRETRQPWRRHKDEAATKHKTTVALTHAS